MLLRLVKAAFPSLLLVVFSNSELDLTHLPKAAAAYLVHDFEATLELNSLTKCPPGGCGSAQTARCRSANDDRRLDSPTSGAPASPSEWLQRVEFVDEVLCNDAQLDVGVRRGSDEKRESAVLGHLVTFHHDADRLADDLAGL